MQRMIIEHSSRKRARVRRGGRGGLATVGERIRLARISMLDAQDRPVTQAALAAALGVGTGCVSGWERGVAPRSPALFSRLARALCVSERWLREGRA